MMEDIAKHMVDVRTIDWEMEYGSATYNLKTGGGATNPASDDESDPIQTLDVHQPTPSNLSPRRHGNKSSCFPISHNDREFIDIHRIKYMDRKGDN
jgi:hypothetical protein